MVNAGYETRINHRSKPFFIDSIEWVMELKFKQPIKGKIMHV